MQQQAITQYQTWSLILQGVTAFVGLFGLGVVWYQLNRNRTDRSLDNARERTALEADHDRRKKQATIEYANTVRSEWRKARKTIRAALGEGRLSEEKLRRLETLPEVREATLDLLSNLEQFATGANAEVFDADLIDRMCGGYLIGILDDFELFIRKCQREHPTCYTELETLVGHIKQKRLPAPGPKVKQITDGWPKE